MHRAVISDADRDAVVAAILATYAEKQKSQQPRQPHRVLVALAGRPGSGKSTAAQYLAAAVQARWPRVADEANGDDGDADARARVCVMPMDGYHLYRRELHAMRNADEAVRRRGAEWTFAPHKLERDLRALRTRHARSCDLHDGRTVDANTNGNNNKNADDARRQRRCSCGASNNDSNDNSSLCDASIDRDGVYVDVYVPSFDHGVGDPVERAISIPAAARVVLVEGNYLLYRGTAAWAAVAALFDVRVFLHCDRAVCVERLCRRHMAAWHVSRADALTRARGSDTANGDLVDTTRDAADLVIVSRDVDTSRTPSDATAAHGKL